ncbi:hypothetical protein EVAR_13493_1 [Eumeta japonica]|uniref:Uncharacterized protein n=1 Tax=Eumeta variegata TaxID=151549 RepID=A0A4C1UY01_EUMVA|nr:hypothetical protein EVAR_13493_1 [Eumeta japonica]
MLVGQSLPRTVELFDKNGTNLRLGVRALLIIVRLIVDKKTCSGAGFARWNSSTKNGTNLRLGVRALLIIVRLIVTRKQCSGAGFRTRWNSSTNNGTDLRLGVRALLIIVRLIVDKKTVQRRWFPRTVELFDEERHRLETWRTGAANHQSTDRGQENSAAALVSAHGGTLRQRTAQT